jgi:hypothetical protein
VQRNGSMAWCLVPQVRVRPLDANLGRGRFGPAHRTFSTHDLWPSTPIRSPPLRSPGKHNAGNCSASVSWFPHQSAFQWAVRIRETGAENTIYALAAGECSDPRLAQQRGEPGAPGIRFSSIKRNP